MTTFLLGNLNTCNDRQLVGLIGDKSNLLKGVYAKISVGSKGTVPNRPYRSRQMLRKSWELTLSSEILATSFKTIF